MSAICGIFGNFARAASAERDLAGMLSALEARGPDDVTAYVDSQRRVFLAWRLLKTTPGEAQPRVLASEDGNLLLVCDGHVFNYRELAERLRAKGHSLASSHSCELLLHLYEDEGVDGFRRADGQFVLALYDRSRQKLLLARDYFGVRPLYYYPSPEGVIFASEIKSLLQHSQVPAGIDQIGISHYLTFLTVPGPRTLFGGIQKLPPSTVANCSPDGSVQLNKYWDLVQEPLPERDDERFYVERVRELHRAAVERRTVDGPIGSLLSGGNDSSANAVLMARFGCAPLHTFTVGLAELEGNASYSDLEYARKVATLIHSNHHELQLSTEDFIKTIPVVVDAMDDMVSEPSCVFLYHALRMAKEEGLRVVVTGEANDELCCGHGGMMKVREGYYRRWEPLMRKPVWFRQAVAAVAPLLFPARREAFDLAAKGGEYFWNYEMAWNEGDKPKILSEAAWAHCRDDGPAAVVARYAERLRQSDHGQRDYLNYIIYIMMQDYYFSNLMLGKLDLLAAHVGVEPRCPYTDHVYAHFVYNIPARFKIKDNWVKYFFKKAIEGLLPDEIIYRPKQGFRTPVIELFRGALGDWARPILLDGGLTQSGFLRREALADLLTQHRERKRDYSTRLWTAMVLNLWYDRWIAGHRRIPDADSSGILKRMLLSS